MYLIDLLTILILNFYLQEFYFIFIILIFILIDYADSFFNYLLFIINLVNLDPIFN